MNSSDNNNKQEDMVPKPLPIRSKAPTASIGLNKKAIVVAVVALSTVLFFAVLSAFSPPTIKQGSDNNKLRTASPGEMVKNLPSDYGAIKKPPTIGKPLNGELGAAQLAFSESKSQLSPEQKLEEELKLTRIRQAVAARSADLSFPGLQQTIQADKQDVQASNVDLSALSTSVPPSVQPSARDDDNRQDDKLNFSKTNRTNDQYLHAGLRSPLSEYELKAGSIVPGVLITGINSDLPGQIVGQVSQNVFDTVSGRYLLLPQGTKIIGEYDSRVSYGQERVLIVWTRLILPNGKSISLEGMPGVDLTGYAGLSEKVNNHYWRLLGGVVFGSVLGAGAQMAQGSNRTVDPTFGQLALEGTAQNINQAGQQITSKNLNIQPTLEISPGQRFNVFVTKDVVLEPYTG